MSIRAMNWAWSLSLPPTQKLLLLALADNADDAGLCWPSLKNLSMKCEVTPRTIQRTIKDFVNCGLLAVRSRFAANGRQMSNGYILRMEGDNLSPSISARRREGDKLSSAPRESQGEGDTDVIPGVTSGCRGEGDIAVAPLEPPQEPQCQTPLQPRPPLSWPGALALHQRTLIESMVVGLADETAQQLLDELAGALAIPGRIKTTPARWIAGLIRRHARGEFVPTVEATAAPVAPVVKEKRPEPAAGGVAQSERVREQLKAVVDRLRMRNG